MELALKKIIAESTFAIIDGKFIYTKVRSIPQYDSYFLVSKDADEITVVTKEEFASDIDIIERNKDEYVLIALNVSIPFYSVGFLAAVSSAFAEQRMDILIISTYSKDYILVRHDLLQKAIHALIDLGLSKKQ